MSENSKNKLSAFGFNVAANTHLDGISFLDLLNGITIKNNEFGHLPALTLTNLKKVFKVAAEMAPEDGGEKRKFQKMFEFLNEY